MYDIYCFPFRSRILHSHGHLTIAGERLQDLGICSACKEGSLSCHTCCDTGPQFFQSHPNNHPIQSPLTARKGMLGSCSYTQILTSNCYQ
jgi:hypothetical protein